MKIEYLLCDICGEKIDFEKGDRATSKFELVRIRMTLGQGESVVTALSPFPSEKVGDLNKKEIVEKVTVDSCDKCSIAIEKFCTSRKQELDKIKKDAEPADTKGNI